MGMSLQLDLKELGAASGSAIHHVRYDNSPSLSRRDAADDEAARRSGGGRCKNQRRRTDTIDIYSLSSASSSHLCLETSRTHAL